MPYSVKSGDTLSAIAAGNGTTLDALLAANPALRGNPDLIRPGQSLALPDESAPPQPAGAPKDWVLGRLSEKYETGGRGPGTISGGSGDYGGVSYGSYQMSSQPNGGTVSTFVNQDGFPWRTDFHGLAAGSPDFSQCWARIAGESAGDFHRVQHDFIRKTHYVPLASRLAADLDIDLGGRPPALQDVVWSTAVQHGPNNQVIHRAADQMRRDGSFDPAADGFVHDLIAAIYAERGRTDDSGALVYFHSSSPAVQDGVRKRYRSEQQDALAMLDGPDPAPAA